MIGKTSKGANGATTTRPAMNGTSGTDALTRVDVPGIHSAGPANRLVTTHPAGVDLDAITPAPTVRAIPTAIDSPALPVHRALQDYCITPPPEWDSSSTQSPRIIKGRMYVTLPDNQIVQIAMDIETGFYRARRPSERDPSGPILQPDPDGRFWREAGNVEALPLTLSDTRLEAFRSDIDFTGIEPGSDGLHRFDGKLYAVIRDHAYQVLHDLDASTPTTAVLRIVRAEDAVAHDANNIYVGTRPGRSEAVVLDPQHGWVGTSVKGAGGMRRVNPAPLLPDRMLVSPALLNNGRARWDAAKERSEKAEKKRLEQEPGSQGERGALALLEGYARQEQELLTPLISLYVNERDAIILYEKDRYLSELHEMRARSIELCEYQIYARESRMTIERAGLHNLHQFYNADAEYLWKKRELLETRQQLINDFVRQSRSSAFEIASRNTLALDLHVASAWWVSFKSRLLSGRPADSQSALAQLGNWHVETTSAFYDIDSIPQQARLAVITDLLDETAAIRASYETLVFAPESSEAGVRRQIVEVVQSFENVLEERASRYHRESLTTAALPAQDQVIDFDFVPAQEVSGPAPTRRRLFRARHHNVSRISVGHPRRTASGEEVIDVTDPISNQVWQTYERRDGEWRRQTPPRNDALPTLVALANERLGQCDTHLNSARQDEKAKRNATNIVESLGAKAEQLDDVASQLERLPNALDENIVPLVRQLRHDSQRLRTEGENIRVRLYKDKSFLSANRVAYLLDQNQILAVKTHTRLERGKGSNKHYLDIYSLNDRLSGEPLWHAHFHYDRKDSAALDFTVQGGHLKTLEQSGLGLASQQKDQQAGRVHVPIWREALDSRTAQRIFDIAR